MDNHRVFPNGDLGLFISIVGRARFGGIAGDVLSDAIRGPLKDRLIRGAELVTRGRLELEDDRICIEVTGAERQIVPIQGPFDLNAWFDIVELPLVNGFGELDLRLDGPTPQYFFRVKP